MKVRIAVRLNPDAHEWDVTRWSAESDFPAVFSTSQFRTPCVDFVIGTVLIALGHFEHPPQSIDFEIVG